MKCWGPIIAVIKNVYTDFTTPCFLLFIQFYKPRRLLHSPFFLPPRIASIITTKKNDKKKTLFNAAAAGTTKGNCAKDLNLIPHCTIESRQHHHKQMIMRTNDLQVSNVTYSLMLDVINLIFITFFKFLFLLPVRTQKILFLIQKCSK